MVNEASDPLYAHVSQQWLGKKGDILLKDMNYDGARRSMIITNRLMRVGQCQSEFASVPTDHFPTLSDSVRNVGNSSAHPAHTNH